MIEYIEKQTMLEDFESCNRSNTKWTPQRVKTLIVRQPPADAAPVIRARTVLRTDSPLARCVGLKITRWNSLTTTRIFIAGQQKGNNNG